MLGPDPSIATALTANRNSELAFRSEVVIYSVSCVVEQLHNTSIQTIRRNVVKTFRIIFLAAAATISLTITAASVSLSSSSAEAGESLAGKTFYSARGAATYHANGDYSWKGSKVGTWKQTGSKVCISYPKWPMRCITYNFKNMTGTNDRGGSFRFWF